jgi:hypothetical protein
MGDPIPVDRSGPIPDFNMVFFGMRDGDQDCAGDHDGQEKAGQTYGGQRNADDTHADFP